MKFSSVYSNLVFSTVFLLWALWRYFSPMSALEKILERRAIHNIERKRIKDWPKAKLLK